MSGARSDKQRWRQDGEFRNKGRYAKVNPCYGCGKSAGVSYSSHPLTDCISPSGESWGDIAICLCRKCWDATEALTEPSEFLAFAARGGAK